MVVDSFTLKLVCLNQFGELEIWVFGEFGDCEHAIWGMCNSIDENGYKYNLIWAQACPTLLYREILSIL